MRNTSWEMLGWKKHKMESRLPGEISIISDMQMTITSWLRKRRNKEPLDESEWGEWKSCLKTQHSENEDHSSQSHHFIANRWGKNGNSEILYFGGSKITVDGDCSHEIKRCLFLDKKFMTNLDSILKRRDITLHKKARVVKAIILPVVMHGCESWIIKKAEHWRIDGFELWCWRRLLSISWMQGDPTSPS